MNAGAERRREDLAKVAALAAASGGRLMLVSRDGDPPTNIVIELACRTAGSNAYPAETVARTGARISLPVRYPFQPPAVHLAPATFHPNVFSSGLMCLGVTWLPTEGLDLLVKRIAQIITFDPSVINTGSPANAAAAGWYVGALARSPRSFPTDSLDFLSAAAPKPKPRWREIGTEPQQAARRTIQCEEVSDAIEHPAGCRRPGPVSTLPAHVPGGGMRWNEQPSDCQPGLITDLLRTHSALDAMRLAAGARQGPAVYLSRECREGIIAHLRSRRTEIGGLLMGRAYLCGTSVPDSWGPLISIERFLASETFQSSQVSLVMGTEIWDRARSLNADEGSVVVGWYHSHPNLGAFFSGTDRATQRAFFNRAYSIGLVVDPFRGEESWFIGPDSRSLRLQSIMDMSLPAMSTHPRRASAQEERNEPGGMAAG